MMSTSIAPVFSIACLGPWQLSVAAPAADGALQPVQLAARKEIALLAYLAVERDAPHSRDAMIGLLFPDDATDAARNNLRVLLSRLRAKLGPAGAELLRVTRIDVRLDATHAACRLDTLQFVQLLAQAVSRSGDARIALLEQAASLHRGEFLQGLTLTGCEAFEQWLLAQREHHALELGNVLAELVQHYDMAQRHGDAARIATRQLALDPLNEAAHRALIRALAAQGQHVQALAQYASCVSTLNDALGIAPSPETQALAGRIRETHAAPTRQAGRTNLPVQLTAFVGRQREVIDITTALTGAAQTRLVTIVGDGGVGKTRMAVQAAGACQHAFADGVFFVPFSALNAVDEVPGAVLKAMDIVGNEAAHLQTMLNALRNKHALLLLDNAEHLLDVDGNASLAALLLDILRTAPRVAILMTSRQRLGVQAEDVYVLRGLQLPVAQDQADNDAMQLFAARARRVNKAFVLDATTMPHVARICALVGGIPLAIELAAAACARLSCAEIAEDVAAGLDALQADLHDLPPSHRSIRACFERSWARCDADEHSVLARLSVFHESFSTAAAVVVCGATAQTLGRLHERSLLAQDLLNTHRHAIHPLLQVFLREKLRARGEEEALASRHAEYFHRWMAEQEAVLDGGQPRVAMDAMLADQSNLRAAWLHAVGQRNADLLRQSGTPLAQFASEAGLVTEVQALFQRAADAFAEADDVNGIGARAMLLRHLALMYQELGSKAEAHAHATQAVALAERTGDGGVLAGALYAMAFAQIRLLEYEAGDAAVQRALQVLNLSADSQFAAKMRAQFHSLQATAAYARQAFAQCLDHLQQAQHICNARGLAEMAAHISHQLAVIYSDTGRFQESNDASIRAIEFARANRLHAFASLVQTQRATAFDMQGDYGQAQQVCLEALAWSRETGNLRGEMLHCANLGISYDLVGRYADAIRYTERSLELCRTVGSDANTDVAMVNLSLHFHHIGDPSRARATALEAMRISGEHNRNQMLAYGQTMLGHAEAAQGRLTEAEAAYQAAQALAQGENLRYLSIEPAAGLARLALQRGEQDLALTLIEPVLGYLDEHALAGMEEPFRVHLTCVQVLQASGDARAEAVLARAVDLLNERAARITDTHTRESYLGAVAAHRTLTDLHRRL